MSRPLRIEVPGGLFHITARGDRAEPIYLTNEDRHRWLSLFGQVCQRHNWVCHAYCLMDNHFHIVVETVDGRLSAGMRQLNGVYTQRHNHTHGHVGHVFQGRFHAVLVQRESYLLELARYVVLNPVRAGACASPEHWRWSSYRAMVGTAPAPVWLQTTWLLGQFGGHAAGATAAYAQHVRAGIGRASLEGHLKGKTYLGDDAFAAHLRQHVQQRVKETEFPRAQRRAAAPALADFLAQPSRKEAITQAHATGCYSLKEIGLAFGLHYTTVSRVVKRAEMSQSKT